MCSIIGITSPTSETLSAQDFTNLKRLIRLNKYRGGHGAGVWSDKTGLKKSPKLDALSEVMSRKGEKHVLVHLRYSTSATHIAKYNHPFMERHVVFVHNGYVSNYRRFGVPMDSLAGLQAILKGNEALRELEGWYVFVWYNLKTKKVHVLNHAGSIQYGWLDGKLYLASVALEKVIPSCKVIESGQHLVFDYTTPKRVHLQSVRAFTPKSVVTTFGFGALASYPVVGTGNYNYASSPDYGVEDIMFKRDEFQPDWERYKAKAPVPYIPAKYRVADMVKTAKRKQYK